MADDLSYCVKCKEKTPMVDAEDTTMKNGTPAKKGKCEVCGTGKFVMQKRKKA